MSAAFGRVLGTAVVFLTMVTPLAGQSVGVGKTGGSHGTTDPSASRWEVEWTSWTVDEVVTRLVHHPVKVMGVGSLDPETVLELKQVVGRMEAGVREVVRAFTSGEADLRAARTAMEELVVEYQLILGDLPAR
jgi:hypothetical protein